MRIGGSRRLVPVEQIKLVLSTRDSSAFWIFQVYEYPLVEFVYRCEHIGEDVSGYALLADHRPTL